MHIPIVPWYIRAVMPGEIEWKRSDQMKLFITFDDGPIPEITPKVLDILKQYQAKATFFCVGDNVTKYPELYGRILSEGHTTGNHTFHHLNGWNTECASYVNDVQLCSSLINSVLFRPPHGRITLCQYKALKNNYKIVMWSVLTGDYNHSLTKEQVLKYAINNSTHGSIVVFHDSLKASERVLYALPLYLQHFSNLGYKFDSLT